MRKDFLKRVFLLFTLCFLFGACSSVSGAAAKNKTTEVVFILDRSGSMGGLEKDTIGGFNSMLEKQKKEEGQLFVTTVLFDDKYEILHSSLPIDKVEPLTEKEYYVRGSTALLDAIGKTIIDVEKRVKENKIEKVLFVITTDGEENSSEEFTAKKIKRMIETQKKEFNWEFLFLGANIDAIKTAENFGIDKNRAVNYRSDSIGTEVNYRAINKAITNTRSGRKLEDDWKSEIEDDYKHRN